MDQLHSSISILLIFQKEKLLHSFQIYSLDGSKTFSIFPKISEDFSAAVSENQPPLKSIPLYPKKNPQSDL